MLPAQRRDVLLSRLHADGGVVVKDLAGELGVAEDSLRRDLRELAAAGLCQRVYGVLASTEKIGTASRFEVLPFGEIAGIVTDADPAHPALRDLESAGVPLVFTSPGPLSAREAPRP